MLEKCALTILELNWNQLLHKSTKLNICHHMLTSSTQLQNRSFHVVERTRTSSKFKRWKMHVQSVQKYCFSLSNTQICRVSSPWLLYALVICFPHPRPPGIVAIYGEITRAITRDYATITPLRGREITIFSFLCPILWWHSGGKYWGILT